MAQKRHSVGIIGLGYGRAHIAGFQAAGSDVVALCQRNGDAARKLAAQYRVPNVYARWEDLLEQARPEIVVIATPPALHLPILQRAVAAGAHVVCEKPLAMDAGQVRAMIDAATAADRSVITAFNWRYPVAMQRMKQMVDAGYLGRVFHINARWFNPVWVDANAQPSWRMDNMVAGCGVLGDQGIHLIDMVRWLFGEFKQVLGSSALAYETRTISGGARAADAEDYSQVMAELASGARLSFSVSRVARGLNEHTLEAYGENGALSMTMRRAGPDWYRGELRAAAGAGLFSTIALTDRDQAAAIAGDRLEIIGQATIAPMVRQFIAAIKSGHPPAPSLHDGLRAQTVLDAILESSRTQTWIDVPA